MNISLSATYQDTREGVLHRSREGEMLCHFRLSSTAWAIGNLRAISSVCNLSNADVTPHYSFYLVMPACVVYVLLTLRASEWPLS